MNEFTPWHNEALGKKVTEALKKNGFEAEYCPSAAEAAEKIDRARAAHRSSFSCTAAVRIIAPNTPRASGTRRLSTHTGTRHRWPRRAAAIPWRAARG